VRFALACRTDLILIVRLVSRFVKSPFSTRVLAWAASGLLTALTALFAHPPVIVGGLFTTNIEVPFSSPLGGNWGYPQGLGIGNSGKDG
jgi:hypothetical protein